MPTSTRTHRGGWLVATLLLALGSPARADLVFESYIDHRPKLAEHVIPLLRTALQKRGFTAEPTSVIKALGPMAATPGVVDPDQTAAKIAQAIDDGFNAWTNGDFDEADQKLTKAIAAAHRNPALLVADTTSHSVISRGMVGLALSRARRGDTAGSEAAMAELIRSYPDRPLQRAMFGPQADKLYRAVRSHLETQRRGTLTIKVSSPQAMIFIDEQLRAVGNGSTADLIPGEYRVFVQVPGTAGRRYTANVLPDQETRLEIDWDIMSAFSVSDRWVGFTFTTGTDASRVGDFARNITSKVNADPAVAVIGVAEVRGKAALVGTLYRARDARTIRTGMVLLDGDDRERAESLARFLAEGVKAEGVQGTNLEPVSATAVHTDPAAKPGRGWLPWATAITAGAAIGAGAWLLKIHNDPTCAAGTLEDCERQYDTAVSGYISLGAGAVLTGLAIYLFVRSPGEAKPAATVATRPLPGGGFVGVSWTY
ncbi:MAG: hypothetical protein AB7O24_08715 [Kofleriaceae bacterium]